MWRSLRMRVALAFGLGVLVLVVSLSLVLGWRASQASLRDQSHALQVLADSTATMLAEGLDERLRETQALAAALPHIGGAGWAPVLARVQAGRPNFSWIGIAAPDGAVRVATGGLLQGASVAERPWFRAALQGAWVGDVHQAKLLAQLLPQPAGGEPLRFLDFAAPLHDGQGRLIGVLGVHATWAWAQEVIAGLRSAAARERAVSVFIVDRNGEVIHRPAQSAPGSLPPPAAVLAAGGAAVRPWSDGASYLTAAAPLAARSPLTDLGWTIVARQPLHEALASAREARNGALAAAAVAAALAAALAWVLAGRFSRPLARVAAAAQAVHAGRLETQIPALRGSVEMEHLSGALRGMTGALLQREAELAQANQSLEQRVQARTAELLLAQQALRQANAELQTLASRDALTGLHNRRAGDERLQQELARHRRSGRPLALALADVDHFKSVNDTHGHAAGDAVLRDVAQALAGQMRAGDLVVRHGGEEFLILMPETDRDGAATVCEKLRRAVARLGGRIPVTLSLGVAAPVQDFGSAEAALEAADRALYAAKQGGRDRVVAAAVPVEAAALAGS